MSEDIFENKSIVSGDEEWGASNLKQENVQILGKIADCNDSSGDLFSDKSDVDDEKCNSPTNLSALTNYNCSLLNSLKTPELQTAFQNSAVNDASIPNAPPSLVPFLSTENKSWTSEMETPQAEKDSKYQFHGNAGELHQLIESGESTPCTRQDTPVIPTLTNVELSYVSTSPVFCSKKARRRPKRRIFKSSISTDAERTPKLERCSTDNKRVDVPSCSTDRYVNSATGIPNVIAPNVDFDKTIVNMSREVIGTVVNAAARVAVNPRDESSDDRATNLSDLEMRNFKEVVPLSNSSIKDCTNNVPFKTVNENSLNETERKTECVCYPVQDNSDVSVNSDKRRKINTSTQDFFDNASFTAIDEICHNTRDSDTERVNCPMRDTPDINTNTGESEKSNTSTQDFFGNTSFATIDEICSKELDEGNKTVAGKRDALDNPVHRKQGSRETGSDLIHVSNRESSTAIAETGESIANCRNLVDRFKSIKRLQKPRRRVSNIEQLDLTVADLTLEIKRLERGAIAPLTAKHERVSDNQLGFVSFSELCSMSKKNESKLDNAEGDNAAAEKNSIENNNYCASEKIVKLPDSTGTNLACILMDSTKSGKNATILSLEENEEEADDIFAEDNDTATETLMMKLNEIEQVVADCDTEVFGSEWISQTNSASNKISRDLHGTEDLSSHCKIEGRRRNVQDSHSEASQDRLPEKDDSVKLSNIRSEKKSISVQPTPGSSQVGFTTATGKRISISNEKLGRAKKLFDDIEDFRNINDLESSGTNLKSTVKETAGNLNAGSANYNEFTENVEPLPCGFSTASGKSIFVSDEKLYAAERLLEETDGDNFVEKENVSTNALNAPKIRSWPLINKKSAIISADKPMLKRSLPSLRETSCPAKAAFIENKQPFLKSALRNASKLVDDKQSPCITKIDVEKTEPTQIVSKECGLKRKYEASSRIENSQPHSFGGFVTAGGKSVRISDAALKRAKCTFEGEDLCLNPKYNSFPDTKLLNALLPGKDKFDVEKYSTVKTDFEICKEFRGFPLEDIETSKFIGGKINSMYDRFKSKCPGLEVYELSFRFNQALLGFSKDGKPVYITEDIPFFVADEKGDKRNLLVDKSIESLSRINANKQTMPTSIERTATDEVLTEARLSSSNRESSMIESEEHLCKDYVGGNKRIVNKAQEVNVGFSTAAGRQVKVSEEALSKAQTLLQEQDESTSTGEAHKISLIEASHTANNEKCRAEKSSFGFKTASGRDVPISEAALSKAKNLLSEEIEVPFGNTLLREAPSNADGPPTVNIKEASTKLIANPDFLTAGGREINVSKEALTKAKTLLSSDFEDVSIIENRTSNKTTNEENEASVVTFGFSTAGGRQIKISDEALSKAKTLFSSDIEDFSKVKNSNTGRTFDGEDRESAVDFGFSTASGREVNVSKEALSKAKTLLSTDLEDGPDIEDTTKRKAANDGEKISAVNFGFSTAGGRQIKVSNEALSKAKTLFSSDIEDVSKVKNTNSGRTFDSEDRKSAVDFGFSTASGREVNVSKEALSKAKTLFSIDLKDGPDIEDTTKRKASNDGEKTSAVNFGFSTAGGREVKVSEEALSKARSLFLNDLENTPGLENPTKEENGSTPILEAVRPNPISTNLQPLLKRKFEEVDEDTPSGRPQAVKRFKRVRISNEFQARKLFSEDSFSEEEEREVRDSDTKGREIIGPAIDSDEVFRENDRIMFPDRESERFSFDNPRSSTSRDDLETMDRLKKASTTPRLTGKALISDEVTASTVALLADEETSNEDASWYSAYSCSPTIANDHCAEAQSMIVAEDDLLENSSSPVLGNPIKKNLLNRTTKTDLRVDCKTMERNTRVYNKVKRTGFEKTSGGTGKSVTRYNCMLAPRGQLFKEPYRNENARPSSIKSSDVQLGSNKELDFNTSFLKGKKEEEETTNRCVDESMDLLERRLAAVLGQDKVICAKKWRKPKPIRGTLLTHRTINSTARVSLRSLAGGCPPRLLDSQELINRNIGIEILDIDATTAASFKFRCAEYYGEEVIRRNVDGLAVGDDARLILDENGYAGITEFARSFAASPGVDPALLPAGWIENYYRWIVWKLASMDRVQFGSTILPRMLTPDRVMKELKYRYDREIDRSQRPALRRILEKDDVACRRLVLCVASISEIDEEKVSAPFGSTRWKVTVTDGWYCVPLSIDTAMTNHIASGKVREGTKLVTYGAELKNSDQGCSPLEVPADVCLKIHTNSTRRARWNVKLGFQPCSGAIPTALKVIDPNGGQIGLLTAVVARVYPMLYRERMSDGRMIFRNARCEEKAAMAFEQECQSKAEAIYSKTRADLEGQKENGSDSSEKDSIDINTYSYEGDFSDSECQKLLDRHRLREERFQRELESTLRENLPKQRDVSSLLKVRITDGERCAILSVWAPSEEIIDTLKEGARVSLRNTYATGRRGNELQLTASRHALLNRETLTDASSCPPRTCTLLSNIIGPEFSPPFGEFDTVGVVSSIGDAPHGMKNFETANLAYPGREEASSAYLSILFWQGITAHGYGDMLFVGSVIACSNLEWRRSTSWSIPAAYCTERTVFTRNPRQKHLREPFECLKNQLKDAVAYATECAAKIALEIVKKPAAIRTPGQSIAPNKTLPPTDKRTPGTAPRLSVPSLDATPGITPSRAAIQKRLEKLQWYRDPPELSPIILNSSHKVTQEFRPPVFTPDKKVSREEASTPSRRNDA